MVISPNLDELIENACKQPTLLDALSFVSIFDTDRAVQQAKSNNFQNWETISKFLIEKVLEKYVCYHKPMFKKGDIFLDTQTSIIYRILDDLQTNRDLTSNTPLYRFAKNTTVENETTWHCSQVQLESGRYLKLRPSWLET